MARSRTPPPTLDYGRPGRDPERPQRNAWDGADPNRRGGDWRPAKRRRGGCFLMFMILYLLVGAGIALVGGWYVFSGGLVDYLDR